MFRNFDKIHYSQTLLS